MERWLGDCWTFCKKCSKYQPHKVIQYKNSKGSPYAQRKWPDDRELSGHGGQTKHIFHKKAKTTNKVVLIFGSTEPNCRSKGLLASERCKHSELGGDKKRKGPGRPLLS